ncbi:MAG: LUD domain-containing protein [Prevotella sp.]|nr:LUD domain-containing protein [Prevotella sp.]MDY5666527.1 LUD domain-containing protein [Alloprevotella sp.]
MSKHAKQATEFLKNKKQAAWHDETLWMVREKRDRMAHDVPEWEDLREAASQLKMYSNSHLAELLEEFEQNATRNGAIVHWAKDADEYCYIVASLLQQHQVKHFVKSKSMLAEECGLNPYLEAQGIEVLETDLGERILQMLHRKPVHIVLPAIAVKKEEISELFCREMEGCEPGNCDQTYLTHVARRNLRKKFIEAEAAMTGANFAVASTGECVVCTNEGNADMGTALNTKRLQITAFGLEKIVPDREALGVFTRLLARSATGQPSTTYTSHYRSPRKGGELHIIIVDNGRSKLLSQPEHRQVLNCLRCGACMNTCPVYRRSGGYAYTYFIPGPIGINLGMVHDPVKYKDNVSACSLCYSCQNVCPAKVDLADQIYLWRQELKQLRVENKSKHLMSRGMQLLFEHVGLYHTALRFAPLTNHIPHFMVQNALNAWGAEREMPHFASRTFDDLYNDEVKQKKDPQ